MAQSGKGLSKSTKSNKAIKKIEKNTALCECEMHSTIFIEKNRVNWILSLTFKGSKWIFEFKKWKFCNRNLQQKSKFAHGNSKFCYTLNFLN